MIEFCKGNFPIAHKTIYVTVCIELDEERGDYISWSGPIVDCDAISTGVIQDNDILNKLFPIGSEYFRDVKVYSDDSYDDKTLADMLERRNKSDITRWTDKYKELYEEQHVYEYAGKTYNCLINVFTDK